MTKASSILILASGSPRRLALLEQIGIVPDLLYPTHIDETPKNREQPRSLAKRLGQAKARAAYSALRDEGKTGNAVILAADTVVAVGRRVLPKPETVDEAADCLSLLSGRNHRVFTSVCIVTPEGRVRQKITDTRLRFKRLSKDEFENYLACGEWRGKAGGYGVQGRAGCFVIRLVGSYTGVVGLPLYETAGLLQSAGYHFAANWQDAI